MLPIRTGGVLLSFVAIHCAFDLPSGNIDRHLVTTFPGRAILLFRTDELHFEFSRTVDPEIPAQPFVWVDPVFGDATTIEVNPCGIAGFVYFGKISREDQLPVGLLKDRTIDDWLSPDLQNHDRVDLVRGGGRELYVQGTIASPGDGEFATAGEKIGFLHFTSQSIEDDFFLWPVKKVEIQASRLGGNQAKVLFVAERTGPAP